MYHSNTVCTDTPVAFTLWIQKAWHEDTTEMTGKVTNMENVAENSLHGRSLFTGVCYAAKTLKSGGFA